MRYLLIVIGFLSIIFGSLSGILLGSEVGSFWVIISSIAGSILNALIYFALAEVLYNQESMIPVIRSLTYTKRNTFLSGEQMVSIKTCEICGKVVEEDRSSCPYCGGRQFNHSIKSINYKN